MMFSEHNQLIAGLAKNSEDTETKVWHFNSIRQLYHCDINVFSKNTSTILIVQGIS